MSIFITGASGFVGLNLLEILSKEYSFISYVKDSSIDISSDVVLHLAGKAHDTKEVLSPDEYYKVNTELTKEIFDAFLTSNAKVFIFLSSVKAVADDFHGVLSEEAIPNPITHYGKSKLLAERYILSRPLPKNKRAYILRPSMIHGPGNKGNLNLLYSLVSKGYPWPLGSFDNSRSYLSIQNLCFIIKELIIRDDIPSGVYNVCDDVPLSTNEVIKIIAQSRSTKPSILKLNTSFIKCLARAGDFFNLQLDSERLHKLTESYVVSNSKIKDALGKQLPVSSKEGLIRTFQSFADNA